MKTIRVNGLQELPRAAEAVLEHCGAQGVVAFYGEMGAGKTTLIREICSLLGVTDTVTSPTFAIVNHYGAADGRQVYHFDFYRTEKPEEVFDLGYEEYFYNDSLCLVEWPEKIEALLPEDTLKVRISVIDEDVREISFG